MLKAAPAKPTVVRHEESRPQPRFECIEGGGMSVMTGTVRKDPIMGGFKFAALDNNTIRGASEAGIINAECLKSIKCI